MIRKLLEMVRFSHTIFALPFALLSATLAWATEPVRVLDVLDIVLCMVFARNFAMAFNRLVDRRIDAANPRTAQRHLPAGTLSVPAVLAFLVVNGIMFLAATLFFQLREPPNPWPAYLAVPVLLFLAGYSLTKRFTSLAHFWLGTALALAPMAAWIAIRGLVEMATPACLGAAVLFWVAGFDILYACQDAEFDRAAKLHSVPARLGVRKSLRVAAFCHAVMLAWLVALIAITPQLGIAFKISVGLTALLLIYEHAIVKPDDLSRVNVAFFQVNAVISVGLLLAGVVDVVISNSR